MSEINTEDKKIMDENFKSATDDANEFLNELNSIDQIEIDNQPKKRGRKPKTKKDLPTKNELDQMDDEEIENLDSEASDVFSEFSSFMEDNSELIPDDGVKEIAPTGIDLLDSVLGGGFPFGALSIVVGQPGSGKSMIAMQTLAQAQLKYKGNSLHAYLDAEVATSSKRLADLGVRNPPIKPWINLSVEKVFKFIEGICLFKEQQNLIDVPSLIIWDSIANSLTNKEHEIDDANAAIGYRARLLSLLIPKYVSKLSKYNIGLLAVNQLRDNISMGQFSPPADLKMMSPSKIMPGGNAVKFNAFTLVEMKVKSVIKPEKYGFEGIIAKAKCVKNKLFRPNVEIEIVGDFLRGFDNFWTNFNLLTDTKRIKTGAWNSLTNLPNDKFRTKDAKTHYNEDVKFKEAFDELSEDAIKTDIKEKYK